MRSRFNISNYSNLGQRVITATVGAVVIIAGSVYSEWAYFVIFGIILAFSQMEFYKLCGLDGMLPLKSFGTFLGLAVFTFTFLEEMKILPPQYYYLVFPLVSIIFFIKLYGKSDKKPFTGIAFTPFRISICGHSFFLADFDCFFVYWHFNF